MTGVDERTRTPDRALRERAGAVIPGGMDGHQAAGSLRRGTAGVKPVQDLVDHDRR